MNHWSQPAAPCANCGRLDAGRMLSSDWAHSHACCSEACGKRLSAKLESGVGGIHESIISPLPVYTDAERIANLQIEIKLLRHRLKAALSPTASAAREGSDA